MTASSWTRAGSARTACTSSSNRRRRRGNGDASHLHEGKEGLDRGAVFAPVFDALLSPRLSTPAQAYLRSVVVDGQWTQLRKYRAARSLSPLCALCGSEEGSLTHRHARCSEVLDVEPRNMRGPFYSAAQSGSLWRHESFASRALLPALKERPPGFTVPYESRWQGDSSLFTGVVYEDGSAYEGQDADLCVAGWGLAANTAAEQPRLGLWNGCHTSSKMSMEQSSLPSSSSFVSRAPAPYVTDSSFVEQRRKPPRANSHRGQHVGVGGLVARRLVRHR